MDHETEDGRDERAPTSRWWASAHAMRRPPVWLVAVLAGVAVVALAVVAGLSERSCLAIVACATTVVLLSPRGPVPDRPVAWRLFAAAAVMAGVGAAAGPSAGSDAVEILATAVGGLTLLAGTVALGFRRDEHLCGTALLDSTALGVSAGAVLWSVVALSSGDGSAVVLTSVELAFDVAVLAQVRLLNASRRTRTTVLRLLSAGLVVGMGHDLVEGLGRTGILALPAPVPTILATAPFVLWVGAALDPSRAALGPGLAAGRAFTVRRVMIVGLAVLVAPAIAVAALSRGDVSVLAPLVVLHLGVVALVLARMLGLVDGLRTQAARLALSLDTDLLTGLESDRRFTRRLDAILSSGGGPPRYMLAMSFSGIAVLNDTLGRSVGDAVIVAAASVVRREAGPMATVARTGAGEFAVLTQSGASHDDVDVLAHRIRAALDEPLAVRGLQIPATAVVGIAEVGADCADGAAVLHRCGHAVVAARETHTGVAWYGPEIAEGAALTAELMGELGEAIAAGQLVVHYQPQVDLVSGQVAGVEALVRWRHPQRGLLAPGVFIPAAERTCSMRLLTLVVLDQAVAQCAAWAGEGRHLTVAVNLSAVNLVDPCLVDDVREILATYRFPASRLELEITETAAMVDPDFSASVLNGLADLGVRLAVDDYGTGYGSLAYLQQLPVSTLKIDRSFVAAIASDPLSAAIVRSTIELAHEVGLGVVAEGVEDEQVLATLRSMGCDMAQGFGLGRPAPAAAAAAEFDRIEAASVAPAVPHQGRR